MKKIIACAAILITAVFLPAGVSSAAVSEPVRSYTSVCVCREAGRGECSCRVTPGGECLCQGINAVKACMGEHHHGNSGTESIRQPAGNGSAAAPQDGSGSPAPKKKSAGNSSNSVNNKQGSPAKTKKNNNNSGTNTSGHGNHNHNSKHGRH